MINNPPAPSKKQDTKHAHPIHFTALCPDSFLSFHAETFACLQTQLRRVASLIDSIGVVLLECPGMVPVDFFLKERK